MPIAEIIDEIDAYLLILQQAREILAGGRTKTLQKSALHNRRKSILERTRPAILSHRPVEDKDSKSNHPVPPPSAPTPHAVTGVQRSSDVTQDARRPDQQTPNAPEHTIPQGIEIKRIPARQRAIRSSRQQAARPTSDRKLNSIKPAIALAGPEKDKIIVVSAEQLQRQREQAAQSTVPGSRLPASGLSGRLAFEALFSGGKAPDKISGQ